MSTPSVPAMRPGKRAPPKLDLRAFQAPPSSATRRTYPTGLIDAHVHLWTAEQLEKGHMVWPSADGGEKQLSGPHELGTYAELVSRGIKTVAGGKTAHKGIIFVQAEVEHENGWEASLDEVESVCAAALESAVPVLALAPWAPVHLGRARLEEYFSQLTTQPSLATLTARLGYSPIQAVRYLLQDSPPGFFLRDDFIDGLRWLGEQGLAFDLTLDVTHEETGKTKVLEDAVDAIERVRAGQPEDKQTVFVVDHFAKPPLTADHTVPPPPTHASYVDCLFQLSLLPHTYLKLSALLNSADPPTAQAAFAEFRSGDYKKRKRESAYERLKARVLAVLEPAIEAFGDERILVGADWPMFRPVLLPPTSTSPSPAHCPATNVDEEAAAWAFEMQLYLDCFLQLGLDGEALDRIFEGNARKAYAIAP
ncbi:hypothetical protein JCM10049v2_004103 [Rhodotorula toruloides]